MGTEKSTGYGIFSLSGHVERPGQFEAPLGITMRELLELAGGVRSGHDLKFWTPGGSSTPIFTREHLDVPLDFDSVAAAGSMLGTRALQVFDETVSVVRAVSRWTDFYAHESCGKCTPCREGTWWLQQIMERIEHGQGTRDDVDKLVDICDNILGRAFCPLGDAATMPDHLGGEALPRRSSRPACTPRRRSCSHPSARSCSATRRRRPRRHDRHHDPHDPTGRGAQARPRVGEHRRHTRRRPQGDPGHPRGRAGRHRDPAVLRPPAARPRRGVPAVPRRDRDADPRRQPACRCPSRSRPARSRSRRACRSRPSTPRPLPTRPSKASWSSCSSTTRWTARSATRAASARCRTRPCPTGAPCLASRTSSAPSPSRSTSPARSCSTASGASCASAAPASPNRSRAIRSSTWPSAARCSQVSIYEEKPFESYFSGNTVQICPVGALTGAAYRFRSRPFDLVSTPSACEHCASGCALRTDHRRGVVLRRMASDDPAVNLEWNCDKGRWAFEYATLPDRLELPLVRQPDGELKVVGVARSARGRRGGTALGERGSGARRRPSLGRGRLRVRQVRPACLGYQRSRLPRPPALG